MSNSNKENLQSVKAGFWIRLLASWIDLLIIYAVLKLVFYILLIFHANLYFPFEFTFFLLFILYSFFAVSIKGKTIGKWLLGLEITDKTDNRLSIFRSFLREAIVKLFSFVVFFLGFLWIGFSKRKKGWHDLIIGSKVEKTEPSSMKTIAFKYVSVFSLLFIIGKPIIQNVILIRNARQMELSEKLPALPFISRSSSEVMDISQVKSDSSFINWLNINSKTPEDYAIETASKHQLTLFGEMHENKDNLDFLNRIIPDLYYKAGVRCVAMEVMPATMNEKLRHLVNAPAFDRELQMQIARTGPWTIWGYKEYWDVLETIWKLNKNLPDDKLKMSIVGIDADWNGPDIALTFAGKDDASENVPFYERFRIFSSLKDFPKWAYRDGIMAYNVKKEILDKGIKGIVWIGDAHTKLKCGTLNIQNNKPVSLQARFGLMLYEKYKDKIAQIVMWNTMRNFLLSDDPPPSVLDSLFEGIMAKRNNQPAGFTIDGSPFGNLHDTTAMFFNKYPALCLSDVMQGVIFFKPFKERREITWMQGYLSEKTFMENKPFYKLKFNKNMKFRNAKELNTLLYTYVGKDKK